MLGTAWEPAFQSEAPGRSHQHGAALPKTGPGPARMGLYGNTRSGGQSELRSHPWAASDSAGASGLAACPRPAGWLPPDRLHVSSDQRLGPLPQPWVPVPAALCSAVQRLSGACVQPGLSRTPTSSRRPLPGGHSHQSSAQETLSSRAPPVDSASAAGCSAPKKLRAGLLAPHLCLLADAVHPVFRGDWSPALPRCPRGPSGLLSLWVLSAPQGPASIWVRSRPRVQNPVAPEVLATPPSPSTTAIPLPLFHVWPHVGTAWHPGQEAPPMEIPPARLHSALKPPSPCPHQRVTLP